jgi:methyltransferase
VLITLVFIIFITMLIEARRAAVNERAQLRRGGIEPPDDVYKMMRVAYPGCFLAMLLEGLWRGTPPAGMLLAGATLFVLGKVIKWWAILTLGPSWTFRVIVVPGAPLVATGPYRWFRHPNYIGVVGELAGAALMTGAIVTGPLATAGFMFLLSKRIAVESRTLASSARGT